jgi:hypothetical protein
MEEPQNKDVCKHKPKGRRDLGSWHKHMEAKAATGNTPSP